MIPASKQSLPERLRDIAKQFGPGDCDPAWSNAFWTATNLRNISDEIERQQAELQRYGNPWTVEILNQESSNWESFAHDAPLTLANAEARTKEHQTENPDAKFRVTPWLNLDQRQVVERLRGERELYLAALMEIAHASTGAPDGIGYDHHGNCNLSDCRCSNHIVWRSFSRIVREDAE